MSRGYYTITRVTDYGPYVTKLVLPVDAPVKAGEVGPDSFSVYVERVDEKGNILLVPKSWMAPDDREESRGYIPVRKAYPSHRAGEPVEEGEFITLEMAYGPQYQLSACITAIDGYNTTIKMRYRITQREKIGGQVGLRYTYCLGDSCPDTEGWLIGRSSGKSGIALEYGYFIPQVADAGKRPLIVWLHGAGEGGSDPWIPFTGNRVTAFSEEKVQGYFGGAYVLAPQCPTFWMNDGSGEYHAEGKTIYGKALMECIQEFVAKNPAIDPSRILIGGDSNGGFMTMRMALDYPNYFAAAFPVCEALYDDTITDKQLEAVKGMGFWFTHAKNDPVVDPDKTVVPTVKRLRATGNTNVHFTFWDKIEDLHGSFEAVDGKPFEYIGHFAWIPVYNDDCQLDDNGKPVTLGNKKVGLLQWLAAQQREVGLLEWLTGKQ